MSRRHGMNEGPDPDLPESITSNLSVLDQAEQVLNNAAQHAQLVPTVEYIKRVERKSDRNRNVVIAVVLLISILGLVIGTLAYTQGVKNAAQLSVNDSALKTYNEAIVELRAQGVPEDQLPPPPILAADPGAGQSVNVDGLIDAASAKVLAEVRGNPAYRGANGLGGPGGPVGPPCNPNINPDCVGPGGAQGQPGTPGSNGTNGVDGTNGTDGTNGANGVDGAPGGEGPKGDTGAPGRGITGSEPTDDPCTRKVNFSDGTSEFWNTCPAPAAEPAPAPSEQPN